MDAGTYARTGSAPKAASPAATGSHGGTAGKASRPVLLVDDDPDFREALGALLALVGYSVEHAENGSQALARLREGPPPRAVILDLLMPEMDGWELREEMLKEADLAAIPLIVVSAVGGHEKQAPLRAIAHLKKPVQAKEVCRLLAAHC